MFFDDLKRTVKDSGVFQVNDAAARPRLPVPLHDLPSLVFVCAEVIAHGLFIDGEFFGDPLDAAGGQGVLDAAQLLESDIHKPQFW